MLAKSKLNSIETLISHTLIDLEINHKEFITILIEKKKQGKMKEDITKMKVSDELNKEESKILKQQNYK